MEYSNSPTLQLSNSPTLQLSNSPILPHSIIPTTAAEIESIVRRVLATLTSGATTVTGVVPQPGTLSLLDRVVSLQSLKNRLLGIQLVEIEPSAVLTPAARDYCKEFKVAIVRGSSVARTTNAVGDSSLATSGHPQRLIVAGSTQWIPSVQKQLCSKQAKVCEMATDDTTALRTIADGIRNGHQAGVVIVSAPHATCWQVARDDRLRPAVVSSWPELNDVLQEVPANVLILSTKTWNVPSACNVARRFFQHLQNQS